MKKLLTLPLILAMALSSCAAVESGRDGLETMSPVTYVLLTGVVHEAGVKGGKKLAESLGDKTPKVLEITDTLIAIVESDDLASLPLNTTDVLGSIVDLYINSVDLEPQQVNYIRAGAMLIDASVGQIKLDIDGKLTSREKDLILVLLIGLATGMES